MASATSSWQPKARPTSTLVLNFEADLDELFNMGSTADLALAVEAKKNEVESHKTQLEDLDTKLRQATERLKRLETKHKRMQSEQVLSRSSHRRIPSRGQFQNSDSEERGFSDDQTSPNSNGINRPY